MTTIHGTLAHLQLLFGMYSLHSMSLMYCLKSIKVCYKTMNGTWNLNWAPRKTLTTHLGSHKCVNVE